MTGDDVAFLIIIGGLLLFAGITAIRGFLDCRRHRPPERGMPKVERLQAVELWPDDLVIANIDRDANATPDAIATVKEALEGEFPGHEVLVVAGIDILVGRSASERRPPGPAPRPAPKPKPNPSGGA
jgi:hypothetical protein